MFTVDFSSWPCRVNLFTIAILLQALHCLVMVLPNIDDNFELGLKIAQRVWVTSFDIDENVKKLAER